MHRVNIYKSSYFFFNKRLMFMRRKDGHKFIFKKIFFKFLYRRSHKIKYGRYEFFDSERTYQYAPLYYRAPFFKSVYFSKLWIFKLSNYMFLKLHLLISDIHTYDSKQWTQSSQQSNEHEFKTFKKPNPDPLNDDLSNFTNKKTSTVSSKKMKNKSNSDFKFFFIRSKYVFKLLSNKLENNNYYWF
jgi:hypothetical protein